MCFLDLLFAISIIVFLCNVKFVNGGTFNRELTAVLRDVAMIGIILHHIHNELHYFSPIMTQIGYVGTALFFFISGYGNMISINNKYWLINKFSKIYVPYIVVYALFLIFSSCVELNNLSIEEIATDLITVSLPRYVSWFPKIILLCFVLQYLSRLLSRNQTIQLLIVGCVVVSFIVYAYTNQWDSYWYNSVFCYCVGCLFANPIVRKKLCIEKLFTFIALFIVFVPCNF